MAMIQSGNDPNCKHEKQTPEERSFLGHVPIYATNCLACGEFLFRFPSKEEVSPEAMNQAFEKTSEMIEGLKSRGQN
jgi:hypothetical protein